MKKLIIMVMLFLFSGCSLFGQIPSNDDILKEISRTEKKINKAYELNRDLKVADLISEDEYNEVYKTLSELETHISHVKILLNSGQGKEANEELEDVKKDFRDIEIVH